MFKFIHAADIHLDSPLLNLQRYEGAPADSLRVATRDAFDNLIRLAIDQQVQFVLIAGDLYDKDSPDFNTPQHVRRRFSELADHGIRVFIVQGNHDATMVAKRSFSALTLPSNVHVFPTARASTHRLDDLQVAVHGQGFASRAVDEDLSDNYPPAQAGYFNIGLLHTNLGGHPSHDNYAPSTLEGLRRKNYQYWALGHIHKRDKGIGGPRQIIHYAGNTQGRHIREQGPKGCTLVRVDDQLRISMKFQPTDVWRWLQCDLDAAAVTEPDELVDRARQAVDAHLRSADERSLAVRVVVKGATPCHASLLGYRQHWQDQLRRMGIDAFDDRVWFESLDLCTSPLPTRSAVQDNAMHGELVAAIEDIVPGMEVLAGMRHELEKVLRLVPHDPRWDHLGIDLDDQATVAELVQDAKALLTARLRAGVDVQDRDMA